MRCALALVVLVGCGFPRPARVDGDAHPGGDGSAGDAPSGLTYPVNPAYFKKDTLAPTDTPNVGGGPVMTWSVNPPLPAGLTLDQTTGAIKGTPTTGAPLGTYTVTAANANGMTTADVKIRVNDVTQIASGDYHACAVDAGSIVCWGGNQFGELGDGTTMDSSTPVEVMNSRGATAVATGERHTCAVINGLAYCWGDNAYGEIGNGTTGGQYSTPQQVMGFTTGVVAIATSQDTSCAVVTGMGVKCWGRNQTGELGNNDSSVTQSNVPVAVATNIPFDPAMDQLQSEASARYFCVRNQSPSKIWCWGDGNGGQFQTTPPAAQYTPVTVPVPAGMLQSIATGVAHMCAVIGGQPYCWGLNNQGETGDTTSTQTGAPKAIGSLSPGSRTVAAGHFHTCVVFVSGVLCFGQNTNGQLGNGMQLNSTTPVQVVGISGGATQVAAGFNTSCAIVNGDVQCWGMGEFGHLGNGATDDSATPVPVTGL